MKQEEIVSGFSFFNISFIVIFFLFFGQEKNCGEVHFQYMQFARNSLPVYVMSFCINICFFQASVVFQELPQAPFGPWGRNRYFSGGENNDQVMKRKGYYRVVYKGFGVLSGGDNQLSVVGLREYSQRK